MKTVVILGITGSIGSTALRGVASFRDSITITGVQVYSNVEAAVGICLENGIRNLCITSDAKVPDTDGIAGRLRIFRSIEDLLEYTKPDIVLNGIAGSAGLGASVCVAGAGIDLALANKETIVLGGRLFASFAQSHGARVIPVDSEHSALDSLIRACGRDNVSKLVITASGGPFLNTPKDELERITAGQAVRHPTWKMGPKISIDSSTLANKGLEVIEAHYLFDFKPEDIEVVIHQQSIVHSLVRTFSGQVYAQLSPPDMVYPIMNALLDNFDHCPARPLDFENMELTFKKPDYGKFPFVSDAFECIRLGGSYPIAYNAANEAAVSLFMQDRIGFTQIHQTVRRILDMDWSDPPLSLEEVPLIEDKVRALV